MNGELTPRELTRELERLIDRVDGVEKKTHEDITGLNLEHRTSHAALQVQFQRDIAEMRETVVRRDVYNLEMASMRADVEALKTRGRNLTTAITGMLLSVAGGYILFLLTTRGGA